MDWFTFSLWFTVVVCVSYILHDLSKVIRDVLEEWSKEKGED